MHLTQINEDRRAAQRFGIDAAINLRPIGSINYQVPLSELSTAGCRVSLVESAEIGEPMIARFPQLEPVVGYVRWIDGATAGLEFSKAIHPAVLDALMGRLPRFQRHPGHK